MTNETFSPADRVRFCNEIDAISKTKKFFICINRFLTVMEANKENRLAAEAFNGGNDEAFLAHRLTADILWADIYNVKMWKA
jgi:hypothetical protein